MFGDSVIKEIREANDLLSKELENINETLDDINYRLKQLIEIEYAKLSKRQQEQIEWDID